MSLFDTAQSETTVESQQSRLLRIAETLPNSVTQTLRSFGIELELQSSDPKSSTNRPHRCRISIDGNVSCTVEIEAASQLCGHLYEYATGQASSTFSERDELLKEIANQILGHTKTQIDLTDCQLNLPESFTEEQSQNQLSSPRRIYKFGTQDEILLRLFADLG